MSPDVTPGIKITGMEGLLRAIASVAGLATIGTVILIGDIGNDLVKRIKAAAPKKTGKLQDSVERTSSGLANQIWLGTDYQRFVIYGARPHIIIPRDKGALYWPGADHPVLMVYHPGIKPRDFVGEAFTKAEMEAIWEQDLIRMADAIESTWVA